MNSPGLTAPPLPFLLVDATEHALLRGILWHAATTAITPEHDALADWIPAVEAAKPARELSSAIPGAFANTLAVELPGSAAQAALARALDLVAQAVGMAGLVFGFPAIDAWILGQRLAPNSADLPA